ncbi:MAG TPA: DUF2283 domain-containing protein [Candidatus Hydrogenedentes bacterium]|mgnify:CR=1 FL=1|nr:MAG: hypothetical protein BWX80_00067 [Candidatus Hydrogenedentes bacterium ADurb.Bin101]HOC68038.1 DUF2283 domain-containing protein [Candidatus Hydrogenedentota bacterium]HQM99535.1 DUF2283 domain-containing protein [Candidatus Hydrogenedentota bacterium]
MKVYYDDEVDALYIQFADVKPDGVRELTEGINLDTTADEKVVGIEFLKASQRLDIKTILSYSLNVEKTVAV